jgi:hypothetical protein
MGVIPLYFVDYIVEVHVMIFLPLHLLITSSSIGCALSAPDGSSPRGYVWVLVDKHRLKIHFPPLDVYYFEAPESKSRFSYHATIISSSCFFYLIVSSAACRI